MRLGARYAFPALLPFSVSFEEFVLDPYHELVELCLVLIDILDVLDHSLPVVLKIRLDVVHPDCIGVAMTLVCCDNGL